LFTLGINGVVVGGDGVGVVIAVVCPILGFEQQ
jgi:hypothetical protein